MCVGTWMTLQYGLTLGTQVSSQSCLASSNWTAILYMVKEIKHNKRSILFDITEIYDPVNKSSNSEKWYKPSKCARDADMQDKSLYKKE